MVGSFCCRKLDIFSTTVSFCSIAVGHWWEWDAGQDELLILHGTATPNLHRRYDLWAPLPRPQESVQEEYFSWNEPSLYKNCLISNCWNQRRRMQGNTFPEGRRREFQNPYSRDVGLVSEPIWCTSSPCTASISPEQKWRQHIRLNRKAKHLYVSLDSQISEFFEDFSLWRTCLSPGSSRHSNN